LVAILSRVAVVLLVAACTAGPSPSPSPSPSPAPSPSPSPTPGSEQPVAQLKYILLDLFGTLSWCDPDYYPVAHEDEQVLARQRIAEIRAEGGTYAAILERLDIATDAELTDAQLLAVYREWKLLNAVVLTEVAGGYAFDLIFEKDAGLGTGTRHAGTIDSQGRITGDSAEETFLVSCPICLARGTLIDTPNGSLPVERLRRGDLVWTLDGAGRRVAMPLLRVGSTPVPATHRVMHVVLDDDRELWVSPGHDLTDGRTAGDLVAGDILDGATVVSAEHVAYAGGATFDLLPAGDTGFYWANGILIASTLR
jgi:hypothetical protein